MSDRAYRCDRILENYLPFETVEDATYKMAQSVADAFLGNIEYGKDYIIRTERTNEQWSSYATRYTCSIKFDEIVRCENCKHHEDLMGGVCKMWGFLVGSQGFCSWGEKREVE